MTAKSEPNTLEPPEGTPVRDLIRSAVDESIKASVEFDENAAVDEFIDKLKDGYCSMEFDECDIVELVTADPEEEPSVVELGSLYSQLRSEEIVPQYFVEHPKSRSTYLTWIQSTDLESFRLACGAAANLIGRTLLDSVIQDRRFTKSGDEADERPPESISGRVESVFSDPYLEVLPHEGSILRIQIGPKQDLVRVRSEQFASHIASRCDVPIEHADAAWKTFTDAAKSGKHQIFPHLNVRDAEPGAFTVTAFPHVRPT